MNIVQLVQCLHVLFDDSFRVENSIHFGEQPFHETNVTAMGSDQHGYVTALFHFFQGQNYKTK